MDPFKTKLSQWLSSRKAQSIVPRNFICRDDTLRIDLLANNLIFNWYQSYLIAKHYGSEFLAVLQPSLYSSQTPSYYMNSYNNEELYNEHYIVYQKIITLISKSCRDKYPIDFCKRLIPF